MKQSKTVRILLTLSLGITLSLLIFMLMAITQEKTSLAQTGGGPPPMLEVNGVSQPDGIKLQQVNPTFAYITSTIESYNEVSHVITTATTLDLYFGAGQNISSVGLPGPLVDAPVLSWVGPGSCAYNAFFNRINCSGIVNGITASFRWTYIPTLDEGQFPYGIGGGFFTAVETFTLDLSYPPSLTYITSTVTPTVIEPGHLRWSQANTDQLGTQVTFQPRTYTISGQVSHQDDNTPLADVILTTDTGYSATTNASGVYTLTNLLVGSYIFTPTRDEYIFSPPTRTVTLPPDATNQDFVATEKRYTIAGQVTDEDDSIPLADVTLTTDTGYSATTNAGGVYTLTNLLAGSYIVTPTRDGYTFTPPTRTVTMPPNATNQNFVGVREPVIYLPLVINERPSFEVPIDP